MYKRILIAYDGSDAGQRALLDTHDLAQWTRAELFLVAVVPNTTPFMAVDGGVYDVDIELELVKNARTVLVDGLKRLADAGYRATGELLTGDAVDEITRHARKIDADLVVVGHQHVDGWAARWWRGSTSRSLVEHVHCNVLVVVSH